MASHGQNRIWFAEFGPSTSPAGVTARHLAAVTPARPDKILTHGSSLTLTSPNWGPIYVIDPRFEMGRDVLEYGYALLRPDSGPTPASSALDALLLAG
jgi:hypothetical protein